ncbi:hypothetical protein QBC39DRAFT_292972 [Podospora conica]|nr:hypothetical protein QBC39DRAFT_292972 [Schizothecium conicum]
MPSSLTLHLTNNTPPTPHPLPVYAYITGLSLAPGPNQHRRLILHSDTRTLYFPPSPPRILQPLPIDPAIPLGPPGSTTPLTLPPIAGGRIWFSRGPVRLTFLLNPGGPGGGAALVEPSVLNPSDPNAQVDFGFCEFTLDAAQVFANISYVDFVPRLPVALTLRTRGGAVQHVSGMGTDGLERVARGLREQEGRDGWPWGRLVVEEKGAAAGTALRVLSPTHGGAVGARFDGYFEGLVERCWGVYCPGGGGEGAGVVEKAEGKRSGLRRLFGRGGAHGEGQGGGGQMGKRLRINTQTGMGWVEGCVEGNDLVLGGERFCRPTTADILGCNSGPFTTGPSPLRNAIIPRLAAAFQRSCIVDVAEHPSPPQTFYRCDPTNHYCRIVHECNLDGKGYAFAYDDVQPDGGEDQSGKVNAGDPDVFIVAIGGDKAYVGNRMP